MLDAANEKLNELKIDEKSSLTDMYIILPEKKFEATSFVINKISFRFNCEKPDACISLYASDIDSGKVVLHFEGKKLSKIGDRDISIDSDILLGQTIITFPGSKNGTPTVINANLDKIPVKPVVPVKTTTLALLFTSSFCKGNYIDTAGVTALPDSTFLCGEAGLKKCTCGKLKKNQFENMYLPPCFDKDGNAISVKNQVLYDMTEDDPLEKVYLFKIKKKKGNRSICLDTDGKHFQFARIKTQMSPGVGDILAVSVIAHKDSLISIDTSYVNYFLDSAKAVESSFTAAGTKSPTTVAQAVPDKGLLAGSDSAKQLKAKSILQGAVTLHNDLLYFNNYYKHLKFIQEKYNAALTCLQLNIVKYFQLSVVPKSGSELSLALDTLLAQNKLEERYHYFACRILNLIADEYDTALNKKSDYRIFTRLIQVPNADELTVSMKTANATNSFYAHKFNIKGGIKIDFSTGVFITGLDDKDFIQTSLRFRYSDSTVTPGIVNRDTTGNLLQANRGKQNFNTGFFVHVYPRTGRFINAGLATGVIFNNSQFSWLLGGSLIFRMGNARLSLVGGLAFGKEKRLDANQSQYLYDAKAFPTSAGPYEKDKLPRFFTDTNISTYDKRTTSWFAGITYNFAGIKL